MFLLKAGTEIKINNPKVDTTGVAWLSYTTKEDKIYEKDEVFDLVRLMNGDRQEMLTDHNPVPYWMRGIIFNGNALLKRDGRYAIVKSNELEYLD